MKVLMPSLRERKRYVGFEIKENAIPFNDFKKEFEEKLLNFIGVLGFAKAGALIVKDKYETIKDASKNSSEKGITRGIIKVNNDYVHHVKAAFSLIKQINKNPVIVKGIRVSGMINKVFAKKQKKHLNNKTNNGVK